MRNIVVNLDLDQVVFDYESGIRDIIISNNPHLSPKDFPVMTDYCFFKSQWPGLKTVEDYHSTHIKGVENGLFETLMVYDNAVETISMLRDNGVYIRIVTHRLFHNASLEKSIIGTINALSNAGIVYDEICFAKRKHDFKADMLIDDSPKNIVKWRESYDEETHPCIIFDQPYNRQFSGPRATDWNELGEMVLTHKNKILSEKVSTLA